MYEGARSDISISSNRYFDRTQWHSFRNTSVTFWNSTKNYLHEDTWKEIQVRLWPQSG